MGDHDWKVGEVSGKLALIPCPWCQGQDFGCVECNGHGVIVDEAQEPPLVFTPAAKRIADEWAERTLNIPNRDALRPSEGGVPGGR